MECPVCQQKSDQHLCQRCVEQVLDEQRSRLYEQQRESIAQGSRSEKALEPLALSCLQSKLLESLRENVSSYSKCLHTSKQQLEKLRSEIEHRKQDIRDRKRRLRARRQELNEYGNLMMGVGRATLKGLGIQADDYANRVAHERRKLVSQLVEIFPLDGGERIANLQLPQDTKQLQEMNADARSAAIATVVRVLLIASSYLMLRLPYRMEFLGCSASIGRWEDDQPQTVFTGSALALESGMIMLRRNVEALCFYQGIPTEFVKESSMLHCLWQLFHSPSLGYSVQRSLLDAEKRVARVQAGQSLRPRVSAMLSPTKTSRETETMYQILHSKRRQHLSVEAQEPMLNGVTTAQEGELGNLDDNDNDSVGGGGDAWDLIERPQPPKPSKDEDILHWVSSGAASR